MKTSIFKNLLMTIIVAMLFKNSFELTLDPSNRTEIRNDPSVKSVRSPGHVSGNNNNPSMRTANGSAGTRLGPIDQKIISIPLYDSDEDRIHLGEQLEHMNHGPIMHPGMFEDKPCHDDPYQPKCIKEAISKEMDRIVGVLRSVKYPLTMICQTNEEVCTSIMEVVREIDSIRPAELVRTLRPIFEKELNLRLEEVRTAAEEAMTLGRAEAEKLRKRLEDVRDVIGREFISRIELFNGPEEVVTWAKERCYDLAKASVENFFLNDLSMPDVDPEAARKRIDNLMVEVRKAVADRGLDATWKAVQGLLSQD